MNKAGLQCNPVVGGVKGYILDSPLSPSSDGLERCKTNEAMLTLK